MYTPTLLIGLNKIFPNFATSLHNIILMRFRLFFIVFLLATSSAYAQFRVSGNVTDSLTGHPLGGAVVHFTDHNRFAVCDTGGYYLFANVKPGTYLLELSSAGFKSRVVKIKVDTSITLDFSLLPAVSELSEVVVTGVSRSTEIRQTPVIIKTVDKKFFRQHTGTNLIDMLSGIPGINSISTGPFVSKPVIRGLGYNRVITLNNGIRQEGQQWGDEHGIEMDENAIERAEIIKGPGSLMYGSDGIAGVLNFLAPIPPASGKIQSQLSSGYQTNARMIANSFSMAGNRQGFQWLARVTHKISSNYRNRYDGPVFNSGARELDGNLFAGITRKWGHSYLRLSSWNNTLNLPEGERDSLGRFTYVNASGETITAGRNELKGYRTGFPHQEVNHQAATINNYFILGKGTLNADIGYQYNRRREFADPAMPDDAELEFRLRTLNMNVRYNNRPRNGWESSAGFTGMLQWNRNAGEEFLIPAYDIKDLGLFVTTQKSIHRSWILAGGLRFDNRWVQANPLWLDSSGKPLNGPDSFSYEKFSGLNRRFNGWSGSIGLSYLINARNTFKLNISRGYRVPNLAELSGNGRHEGTFRYEIGNARLKPENSLQFDLAYFHHSDHLTLEISPYLNLIRNYVYTEKLLTADGSDSIPDPSDPAPAFRFTQGQAVLFGGELYADVHPHPLDWLHIENSFSFVRGLQQQQPDSTRNLPFIPAPRYRVEIRAEIQKPGRHFSNSFVKIGLSTVFAQNHIYQAGNTETTTPSYTLLHAGLGTSVRMFGKKEGLQIVLNADNLTDKAYQNHLSRLKYAPENRLTGRTGIYDMGRNISIKAIFNF